MLTPLALALLAVESADLVFAVDSVPAIFAITRDPFLVFTSNVFAMLGLRSLFFALAGIMDRFHYLKYSLAALLALIGVKMLLKDVLHDVPGLTYYTLGGIALVLGAGVVASLVADPTCPCGGCGYTTRARGRNARREPMWVAPGWLSEEGPAWNRRTRPTNSG
jgi:tellurite resistance protein TerC